MTYVTHSVSFKFLRILLIVCWSLAQPVLAKEASLRSDTDLLAAGESGAAVVTTLSRGAAVSVVKRKGIWFEVQVNDSLGWIKLSSIRFEKKSNFKSSLTELKTGREGSKNNVVATGARGLGAETLKLAKHDYEAYKTFIAIGINTEFEQELNDLKKPRPIKNNGFKILPKNENPKTRVQKKPSKSKSSRIIDVDDDF